jgi:SAM-dependent methyltransferase
LTGRARGGWLPAAGEYGPSTYGDRWADVYDSFATIPSDTDDSVRFLADLAGPGPALELAIGTGRVALPLAHTGVEVHGIDASEAMVARLRDKPGGANIPVTIGDFSDVGVAGRYRLVFIVFNTIWALLTQDDQVRCVQNVAEHLMDDGVFVVSAAVPDPGRFDRGQRVGATHVDVDSLVIEASRHDAVNQRVESQQVLVGPNGIRPLPVFIRYVWPSELDLMARLAGLRLRERFGGWKREAFDASSVRHVSVYDRSTG